MKKLFFIVSMVFALINNSKGQEDPNIGFYMNNIKVDEINCYSFKTLDVVIPNDPELYKYDAIRIDLRLAREGESDPFATVYDIYDNRAFEKTFKVTPDYCAFRLFSNSESTPTISYRFPFDRVTRGLMAYYRKESDAENILLVFIVYGCVITGYTEQYSNGVVYKNPQYDFVSINGGYKKINLKNRQKKSGDVSYKKVDMNQSCLPSGNIIDYGKLSKSGSSKSIQAIPATEQDKGSQATNSASIGISTPLASALKPLDKSKPGYFADKNSAGKITREGYKKGKEVFVGELRMYDDKGRLTNIYNYVAGNEEKNGYTAEYDPETGYILSSGSYKNGEKDGEWKRYKDGKMIGMDVYVNGEKQ